MKLTLYILCIYANSNICEPVYVFKSLKECQAIAEHRQRTAPPKTMNYCVRMEGKGRRFKW